MVSADEVVKKHDFIIIKKMYIFVIKAVLNVLVLLLPQNPSRGRGLVESCDK